MASPSSVPSAVSLAGDCARRYREISGAAVAEGADADLERLADFFLDQHTLETVFIDQLIVWGPFREASNLGILRSPIFSAAQLCSIQSRRMWIFCWKLRRRNWANRISCRPWMVSRRRVLQRNDHT